MYAEDEGRLTDLRSSLINNSILAVFSRQLGLHAFSLHSEEEALSPKMAADTLEAFFGAGET
ncbi:MAG: hypothetical protein SGPRY_006474 [Prymnesium sp.]